jgi:uncharacterized membrane protein
MAVATLDSEWAILPVLFVLGFVVLLAWGAVSAIRTRGSRGKGLQNPEQILDERLARGEIDIEEYARLRSLVGDQAHHDL